MRADTGNLWTYPADYRVITTNGNIHSRWGYAVMGKGIALQAKQRYPELPKILGKLIHEEGNRVQLLPYNIISFPTKRNWWEKSDISLIEKSARQIINLPISGTIVMPPPGCGNGGLLWKDVETIISSILDDRFVVLL